MLDQASTRLDAAAVRLPQPGLLFAIIASCALAYVIPYDVLFDRITLSAGPARAALMLFCWIVGLWLQRANGFSLPVTDLQRPAVTLAAVALGVAIWCFVLDSIVFRSTLPAGYFTFEQAPLNTRLLYYCSRAFNENVLYRLFLGSLFAWLLRRIWRRPNQALAISMAGMVLGQLINVGANVAAASSSIEGLLWMLLRFVLPGCLWAWLYVRHGFTANEGAAVGVHCFLQPIVSASF